MSLTEKQLHRIIKEAIQEEIGGEAFKVDVCGEEHNQGSIEFLESEIYNIDATSIDQAFKSAFVKYVNDYCKDYVQFLKKQGYVQSYGKGKFGIGTDNSYVIVTARLKENLQLRRKDVNQNPV